MLGTQEIEHAAFENEGWCMEDRTIVLGGGLNFRAAP